MSGCASTVILGLSRSTRRSPINAPVTAAAGTTGQPDTAENFVATELTLDHATIGTSPGDKPLRIALLGYRSAPFSGGQGIYLKYLSRALVALGHEVTVISGPPYPHLDDEVALVELPSLDLYQHGLKSASLKQLLTDPLARAEWLSKLSGGFIEPWTFGERARKWLLERVSAFDIVHDNQTLSDGILDLQGAGIPLVTTIHHPITRDCRLALDSEPRWHYRLLIKRWHGFLAMQGRVARSLNHIVTVSGASRLDIVADFGVDPGRVTVMHNGVDAQLFRPMPDIERKPCQIMATASADTPTKGLQVLLRSAASLVDRYPQLSLLLIGKPRSGGDTERLVQSLGLVDRVRWVSNVDHAAIVAMYAESTIAVVPSLYEGFGLPAVEAMACGIPLVSSDGGALAEVVGDGGRIVPAGDHQALAAALDQLLCDEAERIRLGNCARARVEANFSWDVCAQRLVDYYRACIARERV